MEIAAFLPWLVAVSTLISIGTAVTVFFTSGAKQNEKKLIEHDRRIQAIEGELKHLPDREMTHRLELAVEKMSGRLDTMAETLKPIRATTERMNELLVQQATK